MTDHQQLKPRKIALPHSLNISPTSSICLITPEPQSLFKDAIAHPSFPADLSKRITRVISLKKLGTKFHAFEEKRQLRDEHDLFLADDRILSYLAKPLGKTFYKSTTKRPIPVTLSPSKTKEQKNAALPSTKKTKKDTLAPTAIITPTEIAKEITYTLSTTQMHLAPSTTTSIKVGLASFAPEQVSQNIEAVVASVTDKNWIAWRNVRAVHIKGPTTTALPIWMATEMWTDEEMVLEDEEVAAIEESRVAKKQRSKGLITGVGKSNGEVDGNAKKRKRNDDVERGEENGTNKAKKGLDVDLSQEMKERREKLRQQKREARAKLEISEN